MLIELDYPVNSRPRYGHGLPPHPELYEILDRGREAYRRRLAAFLAYADALAEIPADESEEHPTVPAWINPWISALDATALYGFLALNDPRRYLEVGSGTSTRFARRAIRDQGLRTSITSCDPQPRAEIDAICDSVLRQPMEDLAPAIFSELEAGDVLFVDNSHRVFMNSDVTVVFLDILPRLRPGVLVHIHDIWLPYDYPPEWIDRYYSEQYLLAAWLLGGGRGIEVLLPNCFVSHDAELGAVLSPLWGRPRLAAAPKMGGSFWLRITGR